MIFASLAAGVIFVLVLALLGWDTLEDFERVLISSWSIFLAVCWNVLQ